MRVLPRRTSRTAAILTRASLASEADPPRRARDDRQYGTPSPGRRPGSSAPCVPARPVVRWDDVSAPRHPGRPGPPVSHASMTRRQVLKGAVGLTTIGAGAGLTAEVPAGAAGNRPRPSRRERVAVIGAGAGGVAAAYFLAGTFDVDVLEARSRIGGHCDSRVISHQGRRLTVDLGGQFFHPDTHP